MNITRRSWLAATIIFVLAAGGAWVRAAEGPKQYHAFVGTYTGGKSKGIYLCRFNTADGTLSEPKLAIETTNPSFLTVHPNQRVLFAVGEVFGGGKSGTATAFAVDRASGRLERLNQQSTKGAGPCHLSVDKTGQNLLVANYGGGSIACLPIDNDGRLSEATAFVQHQGSSVNPKRQEGPHAHWIDVDGANRFAVTCDLGLDQVLVYRFNPRRGALEANTPAFAATKPGAGPRHLAFHPNGKFAYVINELDCTMVACAYDVVRGELKELQRLSTLPADFTGNNSCAEVAMHPSGRFVYGSNRGHDSIAVFAIDNGTGRMTAVQHAPTQGKTPRYCGIDPTGGWLVACNQDSGNVIVFRIDPQSGRLTATGPSRAVGSPVCVAFVAAGGN